MLYYDRIDLSEGIDVSKSSKSKKFVVCTTGIFAIELYLKNLFAMVVMICCNGYVLI